MSYDYDKRTVTGRITKEPEIKTIGGKTLAQFTVAKGEGKDTDGKDKEPEWVNCKVWEKTAEYVQNYAHTGDFVLVEGRTKIETWQKPDGTKGSRSVLNLSSFTILISKGSKSDQSSQKSEPETPQGVEDIF